MNYFGNFLAGHGLKSECNGDPSLFIGLLNEQDVDDALFEVGDLIGVSVVRHKLDLAFQAPVDEGLRRTQGAPVIAAENAGQVGVSSQDVFHVLHSSHFVFTILDRQKSYFRILFCHFLSPNIAGVVAGDAGQTVDDDDLSA